MAKSTMAFRIQFTNRRAVNAMAFAAAELTDLAEDMPYRPEIPRAIRALKYAANNMTAKHMRRKKLG